jgi:hypothetical protein
VNREFVGVPWSPRHPIAPCAATVDRGYERSGLDRDPKSFPFERVTRNPANVMRIRSRRKGPVGRRRQRRQRAGLLPCAPSIPRAPDFARLGAHPHHVPVRRARSDRHNQSSRKADRLPGRAAVIGPEQAVPMGATPRASANQRIGGQACGAAVDSVRSRARPPLNVRDNDLTVGRNQYHHDRAPSEYLCPWAPI